MDECYQEEELEDDEFGDFSGVVIGPVGIDFWNGNNIFPGTPIWPLNDSPETIAMCHEMLEQRVNAGYF